MRSRKAIPCAFFLAAVLAGCGSTVQQSGSTLAGPSLGGGQMSTGSEATSLGHVGLPAEDVAAGSTVAAGATSSNAQAQGSAGAAAATGVSTSTSAAVDGIPATGPGWDEKNLYVGLTSQQDATSIGKQFGYNSFDFGNQQEIANALINDLNRRGGIAGRKVVPVYYDLNTLGNPSSEAQAECARFIEDRRVAVVLASVNHEVVYQCLKAARIPNFTGVGEMTRADMNRYAPYLIVSDPPSMDRLAPMLVDRLLKMGYFKGWNTTTGQPGPAPVKVGIIYAQSSFGDHAHAVLKQAIQARGIPAPDVMAYNGNPQDISPYVLRMKSNGVTHVFFDRSAAFAYPQQAESQNFRARYAVTSMNMIQPYLVDGASPRAQLNGMMGISWKPQLDVDQAQAPKDTPQQTECLKAATDNGADVSKWQYRYVAYTVCDILQQLKLGVQLGKGLGDQQLLQGLRAAAGTFPVTASFGLAAREGDPSLLAAARDLQWFPDCECVKHTSGTIPIP